MKILCGCYIISVICQKDNSDYLGCSKHGYDDQFGKDPSFKKVEFSFFKKMAISLVTSCNPDEHFNTQTKQCQKCKENESWDPETNTCYKDCNKEGKPNKIALTDGRCIDCSGEKDPMAVLRCLCLGSGLGFGGASSFWGKNGGSPDGCDLQGACLDGSQISFTNPNCKPDNPDPKPDPKPDDNKTKPDPKPDDPKPDPDNPNPGGDGGGGNSGSGGNNGGSQNNPNPGDSPNPNPNPGGGGSGDNLKFNESNFNYDGLKGDYDGFKNRYASEVEGLKGKFYDLKTGLNQFIENVKGNGFTSFQKNSVQNTCPLKYNVELGFYSSVIEVDFCKLLEPIRTIIYYFVYIAVFTGFLLLTVKLIMFSF